MSDSCLSCGSDDLEAVLHLSELPVVCNALSPTRAAARQAPTGEVDLAVCRACGLVFNRRFDPAHMAYAPEYENALHHSPHFRAFAEALVADLVTRHDLAGKRVIEIGCGDGFVLDQLCRHGVAEAVGFDPSMAGRESPYAATPGVRIIPEYFDVEAAGGGFDAIVCRHVLEHLAEPSALLSQLRGQIGDRAVPVYFEVPNGEWLLRAVSLWDVIYEHVSYWTRPAIETLFRRNGFVPQRIRTGYGEQFIMIEALAGETDGDSVAENVDAVVAAARTFATTAHALLSDWRTQFERFDGRAVLWGAGSKGISFANALGPGRAHLLAMVDLNPRKHGLYVAGAGLPVVAPDALVTIAPDLLLISNGLYEAEVRAQLHDLGLDPRVGIITS